MPLYTNQELSNEAYRALPEIGTFEVEVTIPEFDPTKLQVEMLENKIARLNAKHHLAITQIKEKIQSLLAIGHDGGTE